MYDFTNVDPVKCCTWLVLPTVYDESLSYGEQLNKFCKALNELIENNNNIPDYVAEMIQNYITSGAIDVVVRNILANYILNVKYPPKGISSAVGDGSADDTDAIQGCIDYAFNQGGGCVYLPYGKYLSRSLTLRSGVSLVGFDRYSTKIVQRGGDTKPLVTGGNVQNVQISNLTLDGNNEVQTDDLEVVNVLGKDILLTNLIIKSGYQCLVYNGLGGDLQVSNVVFGGAVKKVAVINGKDTVQFENVKFNELGKIQGECVLEVGASDGVYRFSSKAVAPICIISNGSRNSFECDVINSTDNYVDNGSMNNFNILGVEVKEQLAKGKSSSVGGSVTESVSGSKTETITENKTENITGNREVDVDGTDSIHIDGVSSVNVGGTRTEVYGNSRNVGVTGINTEEYHDTMTETFGSKHIVNGSDETNTFTGNVNNKANKFAFESLSKSLPINFPDKTIDLYKLNNNVVNVKDFGAIGNANYYDIKTNAFFTDSSKTTRPTNDVQAVNRAINYAITNNIQTIYFPTGNYYLPLWSYTLDTSKLSFVGSGHSCLCREGSEVNAMITLTSSIDLSEYTYARTPLKNISLHGNSFTGLTDEGEDGIAGIEYGVKGNSDATLISPHINLENVTVQGFACGIRIGTAYKSTLINFNAISCNYGIFILKEGLAQAVPLNAYNAHFEVCNHAVWCLAPRYNEINFFGGAFEYCRQFIASNLDIGCYGTRFESDILAFMDVTSGVNIPGFNITNACLHLHSCYLLLLPNYELNVKYWQPNLAKLSKYDTAFFNISTSAVPGLFADDLEIATDQWDSTSTYFINSVEKNLAVFNSHLLGGIASKTNAITPNYLLDSTKGFFNYTPS